MNRPVAKHPFEPTIMHKASVWSYLSWSPTSALKSQTAEHRLLSKMPFFQSHATEPATPTNPMNQQLTATLGLVNIGGKNRLINTLVIDTNNDIPGDSTLDSEHVSRKKQKRTLVMTHGYGAGLGFYYRCYPGLAKLDNWRIYAIDWLGMANSSRPPYPFSKKNQTSDEHVDEAESFFVDSLEEWRAKNNISKMTLLGHSLGGYLSTCYALKYPQYVEKLILVSPAGVNNPNPDLEKGEYAPGRKLPNWLVTAWEKNVTPQWVIRLIGPFGPGLVQKYTTRRFAYLDEQEAKDFHDYVYHICAQQGSGEYVLGSLLLPGATAKKPLFDRFSKLTMPTSFMYGKEDWMDVTAACGAAENMKVPVRISTITGAGHQVFMDNPEGFNEALISELLVLDTEKIMDSENVQYII